MSQFHPAAQLALTLVGLWVLATLFARNFQYMIMHWTRSPLAATRAYDLLLFPGIVLHELAHVVVAVLLRVPVLRVSLFQLRRSNDPRQGEVIVARVDPLRMSIVGAAPLLVGISVILWLLDLIAVPPVGLSLESLQALRPLVRDPLRVVGLYAVWAIANAMFPSDADRAAWPFVGVVAAAIALLVLWSGQTIELPPRFVASATEIAARLAAGLLPVLIGDAVLLVAVTLLGQVPQAIRRR